MLKIYDIPKAGYIENSGQTPRQIPGSGKFPETAPDALRHSAAAEKRSLRIFLPA